MWACIGMLVTEVVAAVLRICARFAYRSLACVASGGWAMTAACHRMVL
jgi:hypothetical protein